MKKKGVVIFVLLFCLIRTLCAFSSDGIRAQLRVASDNLTIINLSLQLASEFSNGRAVDSSMSVIQSLDFLLPQMDDAQAGKYFELKSINLYYLGEPDSSLIFLDKAIEHYSKEKDLENHVKMLNRKGQFCAQLSHRETALKAMKEVGKLIEGSPDSMLILSYLFTYGSVLSDLHLYRESKEKFESAFDLIKNSRPKDYTDADLAVDLNNYANSLSSLEETDRAIDSYLKAAKINRVLKDSFNLGSNLVNLGLLETTKKDFKAARKYLNEAIIILQILNYEYALSTVYDCYGEMAFQEKNYAEAENYLIKAKDLDFKNGFVEGALASLSTLALVYEAKGEFQKAFSAQKKVTQLSDSLSYNNLAKELDLVKSDFTNQNASLENSLLKKQSAIQELTLEKKKKSERNLWIAILALGAVIVTALIYMVIVNKKNRIIEIQSNQLAKLIEEKEAQNERLKEINSTLSHDIRSPLANILSLINLLEQIQIKPEEVPEYYGMIKMAVSRGLSLTNSMLALDQAETEDYNLTKEKINPAELLEKLAAFYQPMALSNGIELKVFTEETPLISTNRLGLERILDNILSNAFKHTSKNGTITLHLTFRKPDRLTFEISDTGIGMSYDQIQYIFQKRFSETNLSSQLSFGLGMYIAKTLADRLGAHIDIKSSIGKGSTFRVQFNVQMEIEA